MSTIEDVLASLGLQPMGDSVVEPFQNFDTAITRLAEGIVARTTLDLSAGGAADFAAPANQVRGAVVVLAGATVARNVIVEDLPFRRIFENTTAYNITVKCAGDTGVTLAPNTRRELMCTGTEVKSTGTDGTDATSLQGVEVSTTSPTLGDVMTFNGTAWVPAAPTGGSGGPGGTPEWLANHPDAPPVVASAIDDEFNDEDTLADWTLEANTVLADLSMENGVLRFPSTSTTRRAISRPLPGGASNWEITAKVVLNTSSQYSLAGLAVFSATTLAAAVFEFRDNAHRVGYIEYYRDTGNFVGAGDFHSNNVYSRILYIKLQKQGNDLHVLEAVDGKVYQPVYTKLGAFVAPAFLGAPVAVGLTSEAFGSSVGYPHNHFIEWFRYKAL